MIQLVSLNAGPFLDFAFGALLTLPLFFAASTWLAWWLGRGRHLELTAAGLLFQAAAVLIGLWLVGGR